MTKVTAHRKSATVIELISIIQLNETFRYHSSPPSIDNMSISARLIDVAFGSSPAVSILFNKKKCRRIENEFGRIVARKGASFVAK